ncbi:hypothetical protein SAMN04488688_101280 [Paenibacillus sp. cl141a]|uniref:hypothetical protein n=1 Tax=Paenibacillus sp. cl141a TaxID=1761877 RepID=UPI0008C50F8F|nr:hypothetical protein [Paenibacillus sp. cl141a]SEK25247.1 hypothetical protein SAMN04488688_101280 [Paenibacillus sp. cl141a]
MAKNKPNQSDEVKTMPEKETPAPEISTGEAVTVPPKDEATTSKEMGEARAEPPSPVNGERISAFGDIVVPFEKINEIVSKKQAAVKEAKKSVSTDNKTQPDKIGPKAGATRKGRAKSLEEIEQKNTPKDHQSQTAEKANEKPALPAKQEKAAKATKNDQTDKQKQAQRIDGSASEKSTEQA